jgi:hypothetical protein
MSGDRVCFVDGASGIHLAWRQCAPVPVPDDEIPSWSQRLVAYPNPFNPVTTFSFRLPTSRQVELAVFDARGRKIDEIFTGELSEGEHTYTWDARGFASGVYFCRLDASDLISTGKVVLAK